MNHRQSKLSGFTLIEIVVAVGIFAVIAAIVFPATLQFLEIRERVVEKHRRIVGLQKTFQFLTNDLRFTANRLVKDEYGEAGKTTLILKDKNLMEFTSSYPSLEIEGVSIPRRVHWRLEDGILQRVQYPVMDPDAETRTFVQDLLSDVKEVEINVTAFDGTRDKTDDTWEEQTRLPDLIEVTIEMNNKQRFYRALSMQSGADGPSVIGESSP